jgi:hypothetical protein
MPFSFPRGKLTLHSREQGLHLAGTDRQTFHVRAWASRCGRDLDELEFGWLTAFKFGILENRLCLGTEFLAFTANRLGHNMKPEVFYFGWWGSASFLVCPGDLILWLSNCSFPTFSYWSLAHSPWWNLARLILLVLCWNAPHSRLFPQLTFSDLRCISPDGLCMCVLPQYYLSLSSSWSVSGCNCGFVGLCFVLFFSTSPAKIYVPETPETKR